MGKEMTAVEYLRIKARITKPDNEGVCTIGCEECPFSGENNGFAEFCSDFEYSYPEEAVKTAKDWNEKNPTKTLKDDFFEKFPNARMYDNGAPYACAGQLYGVSCIKKGHSCDCMACWDRPLEVQL